jgi:hypothetical protein
MARLSFGLALVSLIACGAARSTHAQQPIFREISVAPFGAIALGSSLAREDIARRLTDSTWVLRPGVFGGAEAITVHVLKDGRVSALEFVYANGTSYLEAVREYSTFLGAPAGAGGMDGGPEWIYWSDRRTRFELTRRPGAAGDRLSSRMTDLELVQP